jgi:hypothetical protein
MATQLRSADLSLPFAERMARAPDLIRELMRLEAFHAEQHTLHHLHIRVSP